MRPSRIAGLGLFATAPIAAGTVVSRLGGQLVFGQHLRDLADLRERYGERWVSALLARIRSTEA